MPNDRETDRAEQNVSDTAFWIAHLRAAESARPDALFRDPFAAEFAAGAKPAPRGLEAWPIVARIKLIDDIVLRALDAGVDCVINLAAGLDTRPYRMDLPADLRWVEADFGPVIDYKERVLARAQPRCALTRVRVDLARSSERQAFFAHALEGVRSALVITEGLLAYLDASVVESLGADLQARPEVSFWVFELLSPGVLQHLQKLTDRHLAAEARMRFAPASGVGFFRKFGFEPLDVFSLVREAMRLRRAPKWMRLVSWLPEPPPDKLGRQRWGGVVMLQRSAHP